MTCLPMNRLTPLLAALLALLSGLLFAQYGAQTASGAPALPLDDAYIHLQYGWQAAQGQFLQYNPGDAPTTGATSLLYMLVLAAGFGAGITREAMPGATLVLGLGLFALAAGLLADVARRAADLARERVRMPLDPPPLLFPAWLVGLLAGGLFAGSGWMAWAFLSGMETGLLITLVIAALWATTADWPALAALSAGLAALTRPEALLLALVLWIAAWRVRHWADTHTIRRARLAWLTLPVIAAGIPFLINLIFTGTLSATGLQAKSWLTVEPFYLDRIAGEVLGTLAQLLAGLLNGPGADGRWPVFPLALVLGLIGLGALWRSSSAFAKRLALASVGWIALGAAATATLQTATWHHHRYQMPLYPALLILLALGLAALAEWLIGARQGIVRWAARGVVIGAVALWSVVSLADFGAAYALDTETVVAQQLVMADWLRENTPEDAVLAVHDVGVMRFIGQRQTLDVVGLTTDGMARVQRAGPGAIYEALAQAQPDYYAVYPDAAPPYLGLDWAGELLGEELLRVAVDPWSPYTSASGTQVVTRPDWSGVDLGDEPQQPDILERLAGWTQTDRLDVADVDSEAAHDHVWWEAERGGGFATVPRALAYRADPALHLTDGGRWITGGQAFTLRTPQVGDWLLLVARVHQVEDLALRVTVGGVDAGVWRLPAVPGEWLESAFLVPPDLARGPATRIELALADPSAGARWRPFHLWAYQGQPPTHPAAPATISEAAFADVALLRGFDLPGRRFAPGAALDLTLYWQALDTLPGPDTGAVDYRVFVHLVDPANDSAAGILAQADGPPRQGTYPFWVWRADEAVTDAVTLRIPADAPAGEYVLLLGVYDGATGARLPIIGGEDYGADRLVLGRVTVR